MGRRPLPVPSTSPFPDSPTSMIPSCFRSSSPNISRGCARSTQLTQPVVLRGCRQGHVGRRTFPIRKRTPRRPLTILPHRHLPQYPSCRRLAAESSPRPGKDTRRAIFGERASRKLFKGLCWACAIAPGIARLMTASRDKVRWHPDDTGSDHPRRQAEMRGRRGPAGLRRHFGRQWLAAVRKLRAAACKSHDRRTIKASPRIAERSSQSHGIRKARQAPAAPARAEAYAVVA